MKLLSNTQTKDNKDAQDLRGLIRTQELMKAEAKARIDLANSQADFNNTLARNREQWALEEEDHQQRVLERQREIDKLEAQRLNALIPVNILKQSVEEQLAEAEEYVGNIRKREQENEDLAERLQDKLDQVGSWEQDLKQKALEIEIRETGLENQSRSVISNTENLNQQMGLFISERDETLKQLKERLNHASLLEQSLNEKEIELKQTQKVNNEQAIRLADERGVLDRAWNELQRKKAS